MTWVAVGTAAAVGAGVGAGSAAIQGKSGDDILESALIGGATGAITGGIGSGMEGTALNSTEAALGTGGGSFAGEAFQLAPDAAYNVAPGITEGVGEAVQAATPEIVQQAAVNPQSILAADPTAGFSPAEINAINQGQADALASGPSPFEPTASTGQAPLVPKATPTPTPEPASNFGIKGAGPNPNAVNPLDTGVKPMVQGNYSAESAGQLQPNFINSSAQLQAPPAVTPPSVPTETPNAFLQGAKDVGNWMDANPFKTGAAAYLGLQYSGAFDQKSPSAPEKKTFKNQYSLSPDFEGGPYSEPNIYKPKYQTYAAGGIAQINGPVERMGQNAMGGATNMFPQSQQERTNFATPTQMPASAEVTMNNEYQGVTMAQGGIARFAEGEEVEERPRRYQGNLMGTLDKYNEMIEGKKSGSLPSGKSDPYTGETGIFRDEDADTRLQDAYTASLTRLKKGGKRANVDIAALPTGIQAGALNTPTRQAAGGGIMQASLGGYAAGGNPRLLSGPGDGMSDNIPATIGGRQPARLADGEFVVPADVVSHLGNGSTNAGAKKLHGMMDKVRMDRTGKKKQAPAVKAGKYMPK